MRSIWKRYIFTHFLKLFLFSLFSFYFLYVIIDYTTHMQKFIQKSQAPLLQIVLYYLLQFIKRADILIPIALLISSIRTLTSLNANRELLAFQSSGIPHKKILRPMLVFSVFCSFLIFTLNETIAPTSRNKIDRFYDANLRHTSHDKRPKPVRVLELDDHSRLVYQYYDSSKEAFFDVIWIKSTDDIWKMKYLKADLEHPEGLWVDHLVRNNEGRLEKIQSYKNMVIPELYWNQDLPNRSFPSLENRSICELWKLWKKDPLISSTEKQEVISQLFFKITFPFLSILIFITVAPFCTRFSRMQNPAPIYAMAIFGFVAFVAFLDSTVILGENAILSPLFGIVSPFVIILGISGIKFARS